MTVTITFYEWAGKKLFFKIKTVCQDCNLHKAIIESMMKKEFKGMDVRFEVKPWLDNFFTCLFHGAWHAPIIFVDGHKFYQFSHKKPMFDQKKLVLLVKS